MKAWTKQHGDDYRRKYPTLTFKQKQHITNQVLRSNFQQSKYPSFLISCIKQIHGSLKVAELGGYNGAQALDVMISFEQSKIQSWVNYDISKVAKRITRVELRFFPYEFKLLNQPFYEEFIDECDLFYSSKTLEHVSLEEAKKILAHMKDCSYQVHIVDWWKADDMHVIDSDAHDVLVECLVGLGYRMVDAQNHGYCSLLFAEKQQ